MAAECSCISLCIVDSLQLPLIQYLAKNIKYFLWSKPLLLFFVAVLTFVVVVVDDYCKFYMQCYAGSIS